MDRNLEKLVQELAEKSRDIFDEAANAVARTAVLEPPWSVASQMMLIGPPANRVAETELSRQSKKLSRLRAAFDEKVRGRAQSPSLHLSCGMEHIDF